MHFTVITLFPEIFTSFWENSIIRRALEEGHISASAVNIRDFAKDRHRTTDDRPYGGGCGMVIKPEPLAAAIRSVKENAPDAKTILMTPQGRKFDQSVAREMAGEKEIIFICGRYEGIDERICRNFTDGELSIGDYVLTGGEPAVMVVIDAVSRLIPGVLGCENSAENDSFSRGLLEHGHFTRPGIFEGESVPEVLLSGNHQQIERWRLEDSLIRTFLKRPDLLKTGKLHREEVRILKKWQDDIAKLIAFQEREAQS